MTDRLLIDGVSLETRWARPASAGAPIIVMLHEELGCVETWGRFGETLAEATGCGVFQYSRAGYGGSDPVTLPRPLSYLHEEARQVLPKVLDAIGFKHGILLGHGDGASIATIYTGGVEDHRIQGLALIAPHFFVEETGLASIAKAQAAYRDGDLRQRLAKYHGANVDGAFRGWNDAWLDPGFRTWNIQESIAYIRIPILIVQGTADQYGTVAQIRAAEQEAYCPVDVAMIEGAGHAPHLERPEPTLAAVAGFVRQCLD